MLCRDQTRIRGDFRPRYQVARRRRVILLRFRRSAEIDFRLLRLLLLRRLQQLLLLLMQPAKQRCMTLANIRMPLSRGALQIFRIGRFRGCIAS